MPDDKRIPHPSTQDPLASVPVDLGERQHYFLVVGTIDSNGRPGFSIEDEGTVDFERPIWNPATGEWSAVSDDLQGADRLLRRLLLDSLSGDML